MEQYRLLSQIKMQRRRLHMDLSPKQKMLNAFSLSVEARKFRIAGLRNQGFSDMEIMQILKAR
jgi:hypothetical protein